MILGSPYKEEEEEVPLFTIHFTSPYFILRSPCFILTAINSFIHITYYYKVGDQASIEVEAVEEQMLIFSSSLTPGRVKGS